MTRPTLELKSGGTRRPAVLPTAVTTRATVQAPAVRLERDPRDPVPIVVIEEGAAVIELTFPDAQAVERFKRKVAMLPTHLLPGGT